jgi:regulatory protein
MRPFSKQPKRLEREALLEYASRALAARALSIGELKQKLRARAVQDSDVDSVLSSLKQVGALNDRKFADSYAAARLNNQGFGSARVLRDLMQRKVPSTVAKESVREAYQETDETGLIEQFLARKYRGKQLGEFLQEEKNLASAYRRLRTAGFSSPASIRVLKRYASRAGELESTETQED